MASDYRGSEVRQAEEVAEGVEQGVGVLLGGCGGGRAERGPGGVQELGLEPPEAVRDRLAVGRGEVRAGLEERLELALEDRVEVGAELAEDGAGGPLDLQR